MSIRATMTTNENFCDYYVKAFNGNGAKLTRKCSEVLESKIGKSIYNSNISQFPIQSDFSYLICLTFNKSELRNVKQNLS